MVHHRKLFAVLALAALTRCAAPQPPPDAPTATQIAAAAAEINAAGLTPADYTSIGITLAQHACASWFSTQVMNAQATGFMTQGLSILGGVAAATGGAAGAGAAAGASALSALLGAAQSSFGAGASPAAIYSLVSRIQAAWLAAMPTPLTTEDAYALVEAFAEQCSLPAIQQAVVQAMMMVPVAASTAQPISSVPFAPTAVAPIVSPSSRSLRPRRIQRQLQSPRTTTEPGHTSFSLPCYMTVMGCRVIVPHIVIGATPRP